MWVIGAYSQDSDIRSIGCYFRGRCKVTGLWNRPKQYRTPRGTTVPLSPLEKRRPKTCIFLFCFCGRVHPMNTLPNSRRIFLVFVQTFLLLHFNLRTCVLGRCTSSCKRRCDRPSERQAIGRVTRRAIGKCSATPPRVNDGRSSERTIDGSERTIDGRANGRLLLLLPLPVLHHVYLPVCIWNIKITEAERSTHGIRNAPT